MAALRKLPLPSSSSPSKTRQEQSSIPPLKSILKKRKTRSPSPAADGGSDSDYEDDTTAWRVSKRISSYHAPSVPSRMIKHHQPPASHTSQYSNYLTDGKGKRRALVKTESSVDDLEYKPKHARFSLATEPCKCKFAKAGCPFTGSQEEVKSHEDSYCSPLYRQLAYYKMLANRTANSPHASTSKLPSTSNDASHSIPSITGTSFTPLMKSPSNELSQDIESLNTQITKLRTDLERAQSQLEEEKKLRTERLRKASERCLELMSLSELGEGKVEVLSMKLKAERELREKLEEELESVRAEKRAEDLLKY